MIKIKYLESGVFMDMMKKTLFLLVILLSLSCFLNAQEVDVLIEVEQTGDTGLIKAT